MILGTTHGEPASGAAQPQQGGSRVTIDEIFRRIAQRRPEALALADAPNRKTFTDGAPRRLTFAQADRMVSAIAGRLRKMELPTDSIVGIQLPNIVENILAILGVMRAGMIAAPLPLLWRRADAVAALTRVGAKALITCGHVGGVNHCQLAMRVAADVFSIRYVCGFGADLPDGVVPFDDLFTAEKLDPVPALDRERASNPAAHLAAITFDVGETGIVPVARSHLQLLAGGLGVLLESRLVQDATMLSTLAPSSFAGICLTLLPWLLERRQAFAASRLRSAGAGRPVARRRPLRRAGHSRSRRVPPGRGWRVLAHRSSLRAGAVALAGAARLQSGLARARHRSGRCVHFWRDRCRRRAPRRQWPAGAAFPLAASLRRAAARAPSWSPK